MSYRLKSGETLGDAAWLMLGDRRLTNELQAVGGVVYVRGERAGPPARWAAAPRTERQGGRK
jgi:hypothetical protein